MKLNWANFFTTLAICNDGLTPWNVEASTDTYWYLLIDWMSYQAIYYSNECTWCEMITDL
jgi:hypothetical protein